MQGNKCWPGVPVLYFLGFIRETESYKMQQTAMVILNGFWRVGEHWDQLDSLDQHVVAGQSSWTKKTNSLLFKCIMEG